MRLTMVISTVKNIAIKLCAYRMHSIFIITHVLCLVCSQIHVEMSAYHAVLSSKSGSLVSSNYPKNYPNNMDSNIEINIPSAIAIEIFIDFLHTESELDYNFMNEMCVYDFLELSTDDESFRLCGDWLGKDHLLYFTFHSFVVKVKFHSNPEITRTGFRLRWYATPGIADRDLPTPCVFPLHQNNESCFELIPKPEVWNASRDICRERGAVLAQIEDDITHKALEKCLQDRNFSFTALWIGAHDQLFEGEYMWTDRSTVGYKNWFPGWLHKNDFGTRSTSQPSDDGFSNEDCVEIRRQFSYPGKGTGVTSSYFWNDRDCQMKNPFICQHEKTPKKRSKRYIPIDCGGLYNLTSENPSFIITSPGFPETYQRLLSCHMIINAPFGSQINFDFKYMHIEEGINGCEFDNLTIANAHEAYRNVGQVLCGNWNSKLKSLRWTSDTNHAILTFQTDNSKHLTGYKVNVTMVNKGVFSCNWIGQSGWVYGPQGCWRYIDIAANYLDADAFCQANHGNIAKAVDNVQFVGEMLNYLEPNMTCFNLWTRNIQKESMAVNSSQNSNTCTVINICLKETSVGILPEYESVITETQYTNLTAYTCFRHYREPEYERVTKNFTASSGSIGSYCNYSNNEDITYVFQADYNYRILIEITGRDIEYHSSCIYDSLTIYGPDYYKRICGNSDELFAVLSKNSSIFVRFKSDNDVTGCGFNISWQWLQPNKTFEEVEIESDSGIISNFNFPHSYPDTLNGYFTIKSPAGRILFEIVELNLPGNGCEDSLLQIFNTSNEKGVQFCGGSNIVGMANFQAIFLSLNTTLKILFNATSLGVNEGFVANYRFVASSNFTFAPRLFIQPGARTTVASVMFSYGFPSDFTQTILLHTDIGYTISIDYLEIIQSNNSNCEEDRFSILDLSFFAEPTESLYKAVCLNDSGLKVSNLTFSVLNVLKLTLRAGYHVDRISTMQFRAEVSSVKDSALMKKTVLVEGSFIGCNVDTCYNDGKCSAPDLHNRSTCQCKPQYTGLFCQRSMCDLRPCNNGKCNLSSDGFVCKCKPSYWGERCDMDDAHCRWKLCMSRGRCVSINDTQTACLCDPKWTGPSCMEIIPVVPENLTIGQKLLKEPIWIGMIVILNLVLFFCLLYIVRRKCGRKLAQFLPKKAKPTVTSTKEDSRAETSVSSNYLDISRIQRSSVSPQLTIHRSPRPDQASSASVPATPEIDEQNREAAFKMFESYKSNQSGLSSSYSASAIENKVMMKTHVTDFRSHGILEGTVSFNDEGVAASAESKPGIVRAYTVSATDYHRDQQSRSSIQSIDSTDIVEQKRRLSHCFPEIKILNENSIEEKRCSESNSFDSALMQYAPNGVSPIKDNKLGLRRSSEYIDSGYPSTNVSSSNTNPNTQLDTSEGHRRASTSAVERRRLYRTKAKSSSFYNITASDNASENGTVRGHYSLPEKTKSRDMLQTLELSNIKAEQCNSCCNAKHRLCIDNKFNRGALSCDSDLENISRRHNWTDTSSYSLALERRKRHGRQASCSCDFHRCNSSYSYNGSSECQFCKCHNSISSKSRYSVGRNESKPFRRSYDRFSSSESEIFQRPRKHVRCKRKLYKDRHTRNSFQIHNDSLSSNQQRRIARDFYTDQPYKEVMLRSFLSDTYQSKTDPETLDPCSFRNYPSPLPLDTDMEKNPNARNTSTQLTIPSSNKSAYNSNDEIITDGLSYQTDHKNVNHLEIIDLEDLETNTEFVDGTESLGEGDKLDNSSLACSPNTDTHEMFFKKSFKDSAYQTKQSSVDKFAPGLPKDVSKGITAITVSKGSDISARSDDKVKRYLHQAALKLVMLKRLQATEQFSKDSAIHTFSEDDISIDEPESKHKPLVKRTSGSLLAQQMKEMNLSRVTEELSCLSRDTVTPTNTATPTNEPQAEHPDKQDRKSPSTLRMADFNKTIISSSKLHTLTTEETVV